MPLISVQTRLLDLGLSAPQSVGEHRVAGIRGDAALVARVARHGDVAVQAPPIAPRVFDHVPGSRVRREAGRGGDAGGRHAPQWVGERTVLERQESGFGTNVTRGAALVRGAFLGEDAHVLAAASGVGRAHREAGIFRVARLRGCGIEGLGGVWLAMAVADYCNAVVEIVHAVPTRVVLVAARAA